MRARVYDDPGMDGQCELKSRGAKGGGVNLSLPVLAQKPARPRSTMGRWRAAVLILVHLLIAAHVVHWIITGSTVSPVEPSEAMETLELGKVNAGFIFFVIAILATIVFGRYFCGWGCHVVALQDLCTWLMHKLGVRPKPFRSRLLVWAPLAFGLYMFVWPTFKRLALFPALDTIGLERPVWLRDIAPFHGFESELIVTDFWATFPPWYVAIPFFVVIGFAAVYFLGSKGFCTYGCPYGGIFGVADRFSPGRIVVNDDCHQCGHCTAVCTSNVRVHEEVRDFGMVVDPGCMKCMDCVSACPNDALRFAFATPPAFRSPLDEAAKDRQRKIRSSPKRFDLTRSEEFVLAGVFVGMFLAYRGMLGLVPMLMAAGMAGIGTFIAWKGWAILTRPNVRVQSLVLRHKGSFRASGVLAILAAIAVVGSAVWSGAVNALHLGGRFDHERIDDPLAIVLRPEFTPTPTVAHLAKRGMERFALSERIGWRPNAEQRREMAFLALVSGDIARADQLLAEIVRTGQPTEELVRQRLTVMGMLGASPESMLAAIEESFRLHPSLLGLAPDLALRRISATGGDLASADQLWEDILAQHAESAQTKLQAAEFFIATGRSDRARQLVPPPESVQGLDASVVAARVHIKLGSPEDARAVILRLMDTERLSPAQGRLLASLAAAAGDTEIAARIIEQVLQESPESPAASELAAQAALASGNLERAQVLFADAIRLSKESPWALASIGESAVLAGLQTGQRELVTTGLGALRAASVNAPDSAVLWHDLGQALLATGETREGIDALRRAAQLAPGNSALATALSAAMERTGQ